MTWKENVRGSSANWSRLIPVLGACSFILLVTAGLLALSSCASTPKGVEREQAVYLALSNGVVAGHAIAPYVPAPANTILEGVLAVGGALLAVWASHLHRTVRDLQNGGPPGNGLGSKGEQTPSPGSG